MPSSSVPVHDARNPVFKKKHWIEYAVFGLAAGIMYTLTVAVFMSKGDFKASWWLYVGNVLFLGMVLLYIISLTRRRGEPRSAISVLIAGHLATLMGVLFSCLLVFGLLLAWIPDLFLAGDPQYRLDHVPANTVKDNTNGLIPILYLNAVMANFFTGSFVSLLAAYTVKRNQTRDNAASLK